MKYPSEFKVIRLREIVASSEGDCPEKIYEFWKASVPQAQWFDLEKECLVVLFLNIRRKITGFSLVSIGLLYQTDMHPREVFKPAIVMGAAAIVLCHNHPSGDPTPSDADIVGTRNMIRAGQLLKIELLDHIVIGKQSEICKGYCSMREAGYFSMERVIL